MPDTPKDPGPQTRSLHSGRGREAGRALVTPIYQTSTFRLEGAEEGARLAHTRRPEAFYTRWGNPTVREAERILAALEGADEALAFSSGMAAVSAALLALLEAGDHVIASASLYSGTLELLEGMLPRFGVESTFVDPRRPEAFEEAARPNTRVFVLETPANPHLDLTDLAAVAAIARARGVFTIADNTWATPLLQRPLDVGVDAVWHSATKYLGGHSDLVAGFVAGARAFVDRVWDTHKLLGGCISPHDAFLLVRGMKTLPLRVERHCENALALARFLEGHPEVRRVRYPGLESHPQHDLARRQMRGGFGGMLALELEGGIEAGRRLVDNLRLAAHAVSLGGVETLVVHPASTTHAPLSPSQRERAGIPDGLVRVSVGLEDVDDLIADFGRALDALA